ncbi:MAG: DUF1553 domain-containing protein [Planctomycetaceae bacterium]|nr:MAG: DUF1553 domain-containing protein [Planctomycetaceae bacterium]
MSRVCVAIIVAHLLPALPSLAVAPEKLDFIRDIEPILQQHCIRCHGVDERNGGLSFEDRDSLFAEADSGARAIVVGEPESSELLNRIRSTDEGDRMPPEGDRLSARQVQRLSDWIAAGAAWPKATKPSSPREAKTSEHWSFQPLVQSEPPTVHDPQWPRNPIDQFIQARREKAGLVVAADADPVALIRRVTYGLTGLPPTPQEVNEFVDAARSSAGIDTALRELVDRLLSRVSYGERWGRHWMDWVRYADTAGDNSDYPIPQAYLYRNYIINSFNEDVPYDQFLIEQLAGDLLPAETQTERNRQTIATGYLAMARRFGSLVERYPWHLTIEDTIDNVGRTMLGLSIACARCHDHKFDPISTRDYYGLYGIFASTRYPVPGLELFSAQRDFIPLIPRPEATEALRPHQAKTDELTSELEKRLAECEQVALQNAAKEKDAGLDEQRKMSDALDSLLLKARKAGENLAAHLKSLPDMPTAYAVQDGSPRDARIHIKGEPDRPGAEVPRKFPDILGGQRLPDDVAQSESGRSQLARWIASPDNPLTARVIVNRVWQRHFGNGLVPTTSDFGLRGEASMHPELLDWLAAEFIRGGWSIKQLHRMILTSRTYRISSQDLAANLAIDPDNRLHWKFNRQRLDAESIRDTLLFVSGSLDPSMPTEPHPIPPQKGWKYTQHHPFKDDYASDRRSVYLMTKRLTAQPYFQTFDGPDPNVCTSSRDESVTALQALYFANDAFLHQQADRFAERLVRQSGTDSQRLQQAFTTVLCRSPTDEESELLLQHLANVRQRAAKDANPDQQAWSSLSRSLLRLNEFLYID